MAAAAAHPLLPELKVEHRAYATDGTEFQKTLARMCKYIHECGADLFFKQFAGAVLDRRYPRSHTPTKLEIASCMLEYMHDNVRFVEDPSLTEHLTSPKVILCVPGAAACVPLGDCANHVPAYLSLCRAAGVDVKILKQRLHDPSRPEGQRELHHVAGLVCLDDGRWVPVDPSVKGSKVGYKQRAVEESEVDVLDPKDNGGHGPEFRAFGSLSAATRAGCFVREYMLGAVPDPFVQAAADLDALLVQPPACSGSACPDKAQGDAAFAAGDLAGALAHYKSAANAGLQVGGEVASAASGVPNGPLVTASLLSQAGDLAGQVAQATDAAQAQVALGQQLDAYGRAIAAGRYVAGGGQPNQSGGVVTPSSSGWGVPALWTAVAIGAAWGLGVFLYKNWPR